MRKIKGSMGIAAAAIGAGALLTSGMAAALDPYSTLPEPGVYFAVGFGGASDHPLRTPHFGLRLDYARGGAHAPAFELPPMLQLDFTPERAAALVNGVGLFQTSYVLSQDEEEGLGDDSMFSTYTMTDWVLMGVALAGIGFVIADIAGSDDQADPEPQDDDGGDGDGPTLEECLLNPLLPGCADLLPLP